MRTHGAPYKRHILRTGSTVRNLLQFLYTCPCLWSLSLSVMRAHVSLCSAELLWYECQQHSLESNPNESDVDDVDVTLEAEPSIWGTSSTARA